jgi:hypothetical protein
MFLISGTTILTQQSIEALENVYATCPFVYQIYVAAERYQNFVVRVSLYHLSMSIYARVILHAGCSSCSK